MSDLPRAFSGASYSRNADRVGRFTPCVICGKAIKSDRKRYVRVDTSNRLHAVSAELPAGDDMGCFPIGSECLRQHPSIKPLVETFS